MFTNNDNLQKNILTPKEREEYQFRKELHDSTEKRRSEQYKNFMKGFYELLQKNFNKNKG